MQIRKVLRMALAGTVAAGGFYYAVTTDSYREVEIRKDAVVAARPIPAGTTLEASMLRTIRIPESVSVGDAVVSIHDAVGKAVRVEMAVNEPVRASRLSSTPALPAESRVMRLGVTMVTVGTSVRPGDVVDILAARKEGDSRVLLKGTRVLAVYGKEGRNLFQADGTPNKEAGLTPAVVEVAVPSLETALEIRKTMQSGAEISLVGYGAHGSPVTVMEAGAEHTEQEG
ncbi:hypothetical protein GTO91_15755 [Heliobacterium undosum]|uniref:SAF domain-containing protein n=1 Tax=Heliomicrobium undosum TaxID=121734 RepID=A0A845L3G7_9FIRM|nr:SAF domain-containing protein [Heliomicrobium undosum]MZP31162.1 hypothetical protein [Heliomicrobium undosum]